MLKSNVAVKGILSLVVLGFLIFSLASVASADSIRWVYSYQQALSQAQSQNKPIIIDFSTEWCGYCTKLDNETFQDSDVIQLSHNFVCLKIDANKSPNVRDKYGVHGYPTIVYARPDGYPVAGGPGFRNAQVMAVEMRQVLSRFGYR